jgi:subtilisin family serine protease
VTDIQFGSAVSSIPGHANASGAISVAAANADNPGVIADYSSQGPVNIVFPVLETRAKPDITGIAGVAVTGAAGFSNPFFGTSAAAPHIAALAALVRQANPALSATQVKQTLMATAADLGAAGFDYVFGAGGADAVSAVAAALPPVTTTTLPPPVDPCAGQRIPKPLVKKLRKATNALGAGNLKRAGALFRQARKLANSYTRGKRPKLTTACAQALGGTGL